MNEEIMIFKIDDHIAFADFFYSKSVYCQFYFLLLAFSHKDGARKPNE
jgi:hypothetical protein